MQSHAREVIQPNEGVRKEKRKPVRRDPEKRRQQNVQAQKRYREKFRERLDHLEALAASAAQSHTLEETTAAYTGPSEAVTTHVSSSTPPPKIAQNITAREASNISVSNSSVVIPEECQCLFPQADITPSAPNVWDSATHIDPSLLIHDRQNDGLDPYWTTTIDCGCSSLHVQIRTQSPNPLNYGEIKILSFGPSASTADPYANNIRIERVCVAAAMYTLGIYVGVTEEMMCADTSLSPFFWPSAESANDMAEAVCTVQGMFKTLKPDLRPNSEQITVKHHPYIDVLPFPTLRKNLITHQEEIDEDEFFQDMFTGLVCWGGAGIGRKDREDSTGYASTGTPWDVRSWEAKVWFLHKYWTLLGGEDGELVRQSEWWRSVRGEDTVEVCSPNIGAEGPQPSPSLPPNFV